MRILVHPGTLPEPGKYDEDQGVIIDVGVPDCESNHGDLVNGSLLAKFQVLRANMEGDHI